MRGALLASRASNDRSAVLLTIKALIFSAGLGTRLRPLTDTMPKALVPIAGHTLLEYQIRKLRDAGINDIIVNVHHFPDMIIDYLRENDNFGCNIHISDEREQLLDTGGGLLKAWNAYAANEPLLALNVDILSNIDLQQVLQAYNPDELGILVVKDRQTQRYLLFDDNNYLIGWTNIATGEIKPASLSVSIRPQAGPCSISAAVCQRSGLNPFAFSGMQILSPQTLPLLQQFAQVRGPKFSIIDFYLFVVENQSGLLRALPLNVPMMDVGKIDHISEAETFAQTYTNTPANKG